MLPLLFVLLLSFSWGCFGSYPLPSNFSLEEQEALFTAVQNAADCARSLPESYYENVRKKVEKEVGGKEDFTKLGYRYCFPRVQSQEQRASWNALRLSTPTCTPFPKVIHQQWNDYDVPSRWRELHNIWKKKNPDYVVLLWTDKTSAEWLETHFPDFMPVYNSYPYQIERIDAFRYFLMRAYGGVYVDIDFECVEPLSRYLPLMTSPFGVISPDNSGVSNSMLVSVPNHPFWTYCIDNLNASLQRNSALFKHEHVINAAGPGYIGRTVKENGSKEVCVFSQESFSPCDFCQESCDFCVDCYTIHHYAKMWNNWSSTVTNWFQCNPEYYVILISCAVFCGAFAYKRFYQRKRVVNKFRV